MPSCLRLNVLLLPDYYEDIANVGTAQQQFGYQNFSHESGTTGDENVSIGKPIGYRHFRCHILVIEKSAKDFFNEEKKRVRFVWIPE